MVATVYGVAIEGIEGVMVDVQVAEQEGMVAFEVTGLPATTIREARHRVKASLRCLNVEFPRTRLVANFAPADVPKTGTCFDLPLAISVLRHVSLLSDEHVRNAVFFGELGLDGSVRPVPGAVSAALVARKLNSPRLFVASESAEECAAVPGVQVVGVPHLRVLLERLTHPETAVPVRVDLPPDEGPPEVDLASIKGQVQARRALEICAAGGHNLLLEGPPGCGKTLLARALPSILPPMTLEERLEVTRIHSLAGIGRTCGLVSQRPFRAPHASSSYAALVGGGRPPRPGEVSLAHRGVLFLDEMPEFQRASLDALRAPLEDREVCISRAGRQVVFPSSMILVGALNPCPCGYHGETRHPCRCSKRVIERYRGRISGPLLDRMDLQVRLNAVPPERLVEASRGESSRSVRNRVVAARDRQMERNQTATGFRFNAELGLEELERWAPLGRAESLALVSGARRFGLTARSWHRVVRIARTIADLADSESLSVLHIAEALTYRSWDRSVPQLPASGAGRFDATTTEVFRE